MHRYSGTPGRTVWAQSRQTNRPSLWAIIDLKSIPAMQWEHRMIKIVSVSVGIWGSCTGAEETAGGVPDDKFSDPAENQRKVESQTGTEPKRAPRFRQACRQSGSSSRLRGRSAKENCG